MILEYGKVTRAGQNRDHSPVLEKPGAALVLIQEKLDGSQFSFGVVEDGTFHCRSKNQALDPAVPPAMFAKAVYTALCAAKSGFLVPGVTYYAEAFQSKRHNVLMYEREPVGGMVLFEAVNKEEPRLRYPPHWMDNASKLIGCEVAQVVYEGTLPDNETLLELMKKPSQLGGIMEGVVIKVVAHPHRWKVVADLFKEVRHAHGAGKGPKVQDDPVRTVARAFCTPARYEKARQSLAERGLLKGTPEDIGKLISTVRKDLFEEESDNIARALFAAQQKQIGNAAVAGLADWYMGRIARVEDGVQ